MASKLQIWNMTLVNVTQSPSIQGPDEDSTEANLCRAYYDDARKMLLAGHDWNFARTRKALALIDDLRNRPDWVYQYAYPAKCLQFRKIVSKYPNGPQITFNIDNLPNTGLPGGADQKVIWTNEVDAIGEYTQDITDTTFFSQSFTIALSWVLATFIAKPLTNKTAIEDRAIQRADYYTNVARATNMNENRKYNNADQYNAFTGAHY